MKLFLVLISIVSIAKADMAYDLLKASDKFRGSLEHGLTWRIEIETTEDGETSKREFMVKAREVDAYVEALSPAKNKGDIYLFNDRTMWFFKPSLKKPVSISARQKLSGQAANGDIASTNYARDYAPKLEKTEVIGGEKFHVLMLKAKADNLTYDQIRYWISDRTKQGIRAEFLTIQGKPFKRAELEYKNKVNLDGKTIDFVSQMTIVDAKFEKNKSIIKYFEPKSVNHPQNLFNINNLNR